MITIFLVENHPWSLLHTLMFKETFAERFAHLGEWAWVGRVL